MITIAHISNILLILFLLVLLQFVPVSTIGLEPGIAALVPALPIMLPIALTPFFSSLLKHNFLQIQQSLIRPTIFLISTTTTSLPRIHYLMCK